MSILEEIPLPLQSQLQKLSLVCPLCSARMPARGLRPKPDPGQPVEHWDVVFTCPACGLLTTFDIANLSPALLSSIHGTHWATQLRLYDRGAPLRALAHERQATGFNLFSVFVISFLTWLILTGSLDAVDLLWGAIASFVVARFSYRLVALDLPRWVFLPRRWPAFFSLLLAVTWQLVKQNIALSIRVLRPTLAVRPGIVAVPTMLRDDIALTLLGSLITLTPDTVTVDIDQRNGLIFVHWIDVKASAPEEVRALIAADFEEKLIRLLK